jgi:hypothetical protein
MRQQVLLTFIFDFSKRTKQNYVKAVFKFERLVRLHFARTFQKAVSDTHQNISDLSDVGSTLRQYFVSSSRVRAATRQDFDTSNRSSSSKEETTQN